MIQDQWGRCFPFGLACDEAPARYMQSHRRNQTCQCNVHSLSLQTRGQMICCFRQELGMLLRLIHFHHYTAINTCFDERYRTLSLHFDYFLVMDQAGCWNHGPICRACGNTFSMCHWIYVVLLLFKQEKKEKKIRLENQLKTSRGSK